jgi:hypothetical protein
LIDTIRYEGIANRKEENREDNGKIFRDYLTILVLGITLIALWRTYWAISDQVDETRKDYKPIADSSSAAANTADAMLQANEINRSLYQKRRILQFVLTIKLSK